MADMGLDTCVAEGSCDVETARNLGVDYVVSGQVVDLGSLLVVSVKLHETASGRLVTRKEFRGGDIVALLDGLAPPSRQLVQVLTEVAVPKVSERIRRG